MAGGSSHEQEVVVDASEVGNVTRMINHYAKKGSNSPLRLPGGGVAQKNATFIEVCDSRCSASQRALDRFGAHGACMDSADECHWISNTRIHHLVQCFHVCNCSPLHANFSNPYFVERRNLEQILDFSATSATMLRYVEIVES